jgi:hypothetical protein
VSWDGGTFKVLRGTIVDIPPGGPLEAAYGAGNLPPPAPSSCLRDRAGQEWQRVTATYAGIDDLRRCWTTPTTARAPLRSCPTSS